MDGRLPLPTLLSHALVAFIIEFDNEFEHQTPHRTTDFGGTPRTPWLVSMVMWSKYLRHIPEEGISVKELQLRTGWNAKDLQAWLTRLSAWWGYLAVDGAGPKVTAQSVVRPTTGGQKALAVWRPLTGTIESRWRERFGSAAVDRRVQRLGAVAEMLDPQLPDSLPILGYGLFSIDRNAGKRSAAPEIKQEPTLPGSLSKLLLAFATDFEFESPVSLAIAANVLRLADDGAVRIRDLPRLSGVSPESLEIAAGFLKSRGLAAVQSESPTSKARVLKLTPKGRLARTHYQEKLQTIEELWRVRFGSSRIDSLRESLEQLAGDSGPDSLLMAGIKPYPDGWRAQIPAKECLPDFPMVLHRGGFPDGS